MPEETRNAAPLPPAKRLDSIHSIPRMVTSGLRGGNRQPEERSKTLLPLRYVPVGVVR